MQVGFAFPYAKSPCLRQMLVSYRNVIIVAYILKHFLELLFLLKNHNTSILKGRCAVESHMNVLLLFFIFHGYICVFLINVMFGTPTFISHPQSHLVSPPSCLSHKCPLG